MDLGLGKAAVVTGASRGIGLAIARRLASEGARVLLVARSAHALETATAALPGVAAHAAQVRGVREVEAPPRVVEDAAARFGRLDVLVNCAGATRRGDFLELGDGAVAFLASGQAAYLQGAILDADGGWVRAV